MRDYNRLVIEASSKATAAKLTHKTAQESFRTAMDEESYSLEALQICQVTAQAVQQQVHSRLASVVCRCLSTIFDEPYTFDLRFEMKRGRTEAVLVFIRDGIELRNPQDEAGGGVVDVAAFALRLAALMLARPQSRRVLVLDEPFRFLSAEYRPRVSALLTTLAAELGCQIIMVTHIPELTGDVTIEL